MTPLDFEICFFLLTFCRKMLVSWFHVGKMKFHHCWPIPGKMRLATIWKNPLLSHPWKKSFRRQWSFVVDQGFSNLFERVPLSIKRIISRQLRYAGVIVQLCKYVNILHFSIDQIIFKLEPNVFEC